MLTVHKAKGLEWDVVGRPHGQGLPRQATPATGRVKDPGAVPAELRLTDREELPRLAAARPGLGRPGRGEAGAGGLRPGLEGLRASGRGDPPRLRRGHPGPARPAGARAAGGGDGKTVCGPSSLADDGPRPPARPVRARSPTGPTRRPTTPPTRRWRSGRSGPVAGGPADLGPAPRVDRRRGPGHGRGAAHPLDAERGCSSTAPTRAARAVGARRRCAAARAPAAAPGRGHGGGASPPVGLSVGPAGRRPGPVRPGPTPADALGASPRRPAGHRLPRLGRAALRPGRPGRRHRSARLGRRGGRG